MIPSGVGEVRGGGQRRWRRAETRGEELPLSRLLAAAAEDLLRRDSVLLLFFLLLRLPSSAGC